MPQVLADHRLSWLCTTLKEIGKATKYDKFWQIIIELVMSFKKGFVCILGF